MLSGPLPKIIVGSSSSCLKDVVLMQEPAEPPPAEDFPMDDDDDYDDIARADRAEDAAGATDDASPQGEAALGKQYVAELFPGMFRIRATDMLQAKEGHGFISTAAVQGRL